MKGGWAVVALVMVATGCAPATPLVRALPDSPECREHSGLPVMIADAGPPSAAPEDVADSLVKALGHSQRTENWRRRTDSGRTLELAAAPYLVEVVRSDGGWLGASIRECLKTWN